MKGLYVGLLPTALKQASNVAFRFAFYDITKTYLKTKINQKDIVNAMSGGIAGALGCFLNNPIDVIKSHAQGIEEKEGQSTIQITKNIYKTHGMKGFMAGAGVRSVRVGLAQAITFFSYERVVELLQAV